CERAKRRYFIILLAILSNSDSFDLKTFEVRGRPVKPVPGLRPGMSVIFAWPFDPVMEDGH
ncbi:hypothetical protein, partial [Desulfovibrio sp.]